MDEKLTRFVQAQRPVLNQFLEDQLTRDVAQPTLARSMSYSLLAGGKRLRPLLYLATIFSFDQSVDLTQELPIAGAIELIHTYSLIHDDLPAMDNDDYRRGRLTNHKKFGEAMAILAGDGLLTLAFEWVAKSPVDPLVLSEMIRVLAQASGPSGMVAGQAIDIEQTGHPLHELAAIQQLDALKTGRLLTAPLQMASIKLKLDERLRQALVEFGQHFGVAFQIYDDLLDLTSTQAAQGKQVHKDEAAGKNTYPELLGIPQARQQLQTELDQAHLSLTAVTEGTSFNPELLLSFLSYFDEERES